MEKRLALFESAWSGFLLSSMMAFLGCVEFPREVRAEPYPYASPTPSPETLPGDTGESLAGDQMYFAPKLGVAVPFNLDDYGAQFSWGGEIGFRAGRKVTLGVNVSTSKSDFDLRNVEANVTPVLLKLNYYPNFNNGFFIGPQGGMVIESGDSVLGDETELGAGIALGYDYKITPNLTTGIEVAHVAVFGDDIYHMVNFVVPLKVHF